MNTIWNLGPRWQKPLKYVDLIPFSPEKRPGPLLEIKKNWKEKWGYAYQKLFSYAGGII